MRKYFYKGTEITEKYARSNGYYEIKEYMPYNKVRILIRELNVKDFKLSGEQIAYYEDGTLFFTCYYEKGVRHGKASYYDRERTKIATWEYKEGLRYGKYVEWFDKNQKKCEINFSEGSPSGEFVAFIKGRHLYDVRGKYTQEVEHKIVEGDWHGEKTFYVPYTKEQLYVGIATNDIRCKAIFDSMVNRYIPEDQFEKTFKF